MSSESRYVFIIKKIAPSRADSAILPTVSTVTLSKVIRSTYANSLINKVNSQLSNKMSKPFFPVPEVTTRFYSFTVCRVAGFVSMKRSRVDVRALMKDYY